MGDRGARAAGAAPPPAAGADCRRAAFERQQELRRTGRGRRRERTPVADKLYAELSARVGFGELPTSGLPFGPGPRFWRLLAPPAEAAADEPRLPLDVPGTLACCGFDRDLFWTDPATGEVRARADPPKRLVRRHVLGGPHPVLVARTSRGSNKSDAQLLPRDQAPQFLEAPASEDRNVAVQQYVASAAANACIARVAWRRGGEPAQCWSISARHVRAPADVAAKAAAAAASPQMLNTQLCYLTSSESPEHCAIQAVSGHNWAEPHALARRVARYADRQARRRHRLTFEELVADFVRDERGAWVMLGVKAFRCRGLPERPPNSVNVAAHNGLSHPSRCKGDYCRSLAALEDAEHLDEASAFVVGDIKGAEVLRPAEKRKLAQRLAPVLRGRGAAGAGGRSGEMNMIPYRSIAQDRAESARGAPAPKWQYRRGGEWQDYSPGVVLALEGALERSERTAKVSLSATVDLKDMVQREAGRPTPVPVRRMPPAAFLPGRLPDPRRRPGTRARDSHTAVLYDMVPVCQDCLRVYLKKDRNRMMSKLQRPAGGGGGGGGLLAGSSRLVPP